MTERVHQERAGVDHVAPPGSEQGDDMLSPRLFGLAAILGAVGVGFCCLAPVIFSVLGVSSIDALTTLKYVVPYSTVFVGVTLLSLGLAVWSVVLRRGRVSRMEWVVLGGSVLVVGAILAYTIRFEGLPRPW